MRRAKVYVARQLIHVINCTIGRASHELWRVANVEADGLTERQYHLIQDANMKLAEAGGILTVVGSELQDYLNTH